MPDTDPRKVLVTGATGNQGGAVVDALLQSDLAYEIYGLTRDRSGDFAQELQLRGVEMVEGDMADKSSIKPHIEEVDTVFLVTNFWTAGYDGQVEQGTNVAEVAADVGIEHLVFSGVGSHDQETGIPHFDSAWEIDQKIQELEVPNTVLKPVFFYQNFEGMRETIEGGRIAMPLKEGVRLQMIDVADIGRVAATVIASPDEYVGERRELAGGSYTLINVAQVFTRILDRYINAVHVPISVAREQLGEEMADMFEWFNEVGYNANVSALEDEFSIQFTDLESYAKREGWEPELPEQVEEE
mgnify:CR=1 FL=1